MGTGDGAYSVEPHEAEAWQAVESPRLNCQREHQNLLRCSSVSLIVKAWPLPSRHQQSAEGAAPLPGRHIQRSSRAVTPVRTRPCRPSKAYRKAKVRPKRQALSVALRRLARSGCHLVYKTRMWTFFIQFSEFGTRFNRPKSQVKSRPSGLWMMSSSSDKSSKSRTLLPPYSPDA